MNLRRVATSELVKELEARAAGAKQQKLPLDTRQNHTLLKRDSLGRFLPSKG